MVWNKFGLSNEFLTNELVLLSQSLPMSKYLFGICNRDLIADGYSTVNMDQNENCEINGAQLN